MEMDTYAINQESARVAWNAACCEEAVYIQKVEMTYWRIYGENDAWLGQVDLSYSPPRVTPHGSYRHMLLREAAVSG